MKSNLPETISEELFEKFCNFNSFVLSKIPVSSKPTPDYKMWIDDYLIYVEVKQLDRNNEDETFAVRAREEKISSMWSNTTVRIRGTIDDARRQFKTIKSKECPTLLVIYDNTKLGIIDNDDVISAMYGDEITRMKINDDTGEIVSYQLLIGGNKKFNSFMNTSISAISILRKMWNGCLYLIVYHNCYARHPIDITILQSEQITHYVPGNKH